MLFLVYTSVEALAGQWAYSLLTDGRGMAPAVAGLAASGYWGGLTAGRVVTGGATRRLPPSLLLRWCVAVAPVWGLLLASASGPLADVAALGLLGFTLGPVFLMLIAGTAARVGAAHSANAVGLQIAAASLGTAALPALGGVVDGRFGIQAIADLLAGSALLVVALHEGVLAWEGASRAKADDRATRREARSPSSITSSAAPRARPEALISS